MKKLAVNGPVPGAGFVSGGVGAEEGVFRALQGVERQHSASIEGPEGRIEAAHRRGTHTVLETSGPPFGTGCSRVVHVACFRRVGDRLLKLVSPGHGDRR